MNELHIASCIVRTSLSQLAAVQSRIEALPGCEVMANNASVKLVVVMEGPDTSSLLESIDAIRALPGVDNVNLVYQHAESETAMKAPLPCP